MIIAIYLKTESGDGYHFQKEVNTETEMLGELILAMDTELAHVYHYEVSTIGGSASKMQDLLQDHIDLLQELSEDE